MAEKLEAAGKRAFTLVEILIVVSIIAILAAIAIPNFLQAQTRAKVSRAKADLKTLATAEEVYSVDHNGYTEDQISFILSDPSSRQGFRHLSTPVAYMTQAYLRDPFGEGMSADMETDAINYFYIMGSGMDVALDSPSTSTAVIKSYMLVCCGPDKKLSSCLLPYWPYGRLTSPIQACNVCPYDPTNGTTSAGDIIRVGGDVNNPAGLWYICDVPHTQWSTNDF